MVGELNVLNEWIPEQMQPGTIFVLENAGHVGEKEDPYWAVLACPDCGTLGLITRKQLAGLLPVICASAQCWVQFFINDSDIVIRKPCCPRTLVIRGKARLQSCRNLLKINPA